MKSHSYGRVSLPVEQPCAALRFIRSRVGAFFLGFFSCGLLCGYVAGILHWPN